MTEDDETARALRDRIERRVATLAPPTGLYETVRRRHRRQRTAAVAGVAAAVLVGIGVPAGLARTTAAPTAPAVVPTPSATPVPPRTPCVVGVSGLPAAVPANQLPAQTDVRGSLAGDRAVVDAAAVAGWRGLRQHIRAQSAFTRKPDPASLRVRFVERAGSGTLALVTAADTTGEWQQGEWVVGSGRVLVPVGGPNSTVTSDRSAGGQFWGDDPLYVDSQQVCGIPYGVVLAPPDATATIAGVPHIGADARPVPGPTRPLPLAGGLAVLPGDQSSNQTVTVSRAGSVLGSQTFAADPGGDPSPDRAPTAAQVAAAVRDSPAPVPAALLAEVVEFGARDLLARTTDRVTGVRVLWTGPWSHQKPGVLVALRLPSGADYVLFAGTPPGRGSGDVVSFEFGGSLPAGRADDTVFTWRSGTTLAVIDPGATRAEADLDDDRTIPVPLTGGAGLVVVPGGRAKVLEVRTYDSGGTEIGRATPGSVLRNLPGKG